jgi:hypothetical protein
MIHSTLAESTADIFRETNCFGNLLVGLPTTYKAVNNFVAYQYGTGSISQVDSATVGPSVAYPAADSGRSSSSRRNTVAFNESFMQMPVKPDYELK